MKKKLLATAALLLLCPFAVPNSVLCQDLSMNMEDETLAMYFDMDEVVETPTSVAKSIKQVAENVTIITAQDIERMNAHSVAEVLNRVPGFSVGFNGRGFNQSTAFHVQDSDYEHVLVLVDGVRWNDISAGMAVTNSIPVAIIDRIEVIKGPASSTWGSALGGVVNIISKKTGKNTRPSGTVSASYGEYNSQEYQVDITGKAGPVGYFVAAGSQSSDGFLHNRYYDQEDIFGKASIDLPHQTTLTILSGYSEPEMRFFDWDKYSYGATGTDRNFWSTVTVDTLVCDTVSLNVGAFRYQQKYIRDYYTLPDRMTYFDAFDDNTATGFNSRLTSLFDSQVLVLGGEFERDHHDDATSQRDYDETWALFLNDTITLGSFTLTPGVRYDHFSLTDSITSPSLGITWQAADHTLFRFLASRGFRKPYMSTAINAVPGLEAEKVTSYQAGVETTLLPACRLKATLFEHHVKDEWDYDYATDLYYNGGKAKRYGVEVEVETFPWHDFSALASYTYVYTGTYGTEVNDDSYSAKLTLRYDNPDFVIADLFGRYMWWNENLKSNTGMTAMVWDLSLTKPLQLNERSSMDLFFTAHNLFDGRDYWHEIYDNAHRWVEAGIKFHF
ncbi:MAG: TonB-dependent receptor [Desulfobulbaceae bacterium]|nr:TonB-dependent receptor [Desulfobulbaceae bacterium]